MIVIDKCQEEHRKNLKTPTDKIPKRIDNSVTLDSRKKPERSLKNRT